MLAALSMLVVPALAITYVVGGLVIITNAIAR